MTRKIYALIAALMMYPGICTVWAQEFPNRPITIVVPYGPGGTTDIQARLIQDGLGKELGQTVVIDNRPGASGAIGSLYVARAKPDGHTLLVPNNGLLTAPLLNENIGFDPFKDFKPVGLISTVPMALVVNKAVPATDAKSFFAWARKQPDGIMYASAGQASYGTLSTVRLAQLAGFKAENIPYKGEAASTMAVSAGEVQMLLTTTSSSMLGQVQQGNLALLGVGSAEPSPVTPGAPTLNEALPGFVAEAFFGLLAPAGTPDDVIAKINTALKNVLADEDLQAKMLRGGVVPRTSSPAEFDQFMRTDYEQLRAIITQLNIKTE